MQILFVDESGTPPPANKNAPRHFVLGGVVIPEDVWHKVSHDLNVLKAQHNITGEIKWRYFSPHNHKTDNSLAHLPPKEREALRSSLYAIISKYKSIRILSVVVHVQTAYTLPYIRNADDLYWYAYKQLTERFQYYLQDLQRTVGQSINGIIVCDHRAPRDDERLRHLHQQLLSSDKDNTARYTNLIEGVFIAPSHYSVGIQFADVVAGAVFRKFENDDGRFFNLILKSFRMSPTGKIEGYGLVQFPKPRR